MRMLRPVCWVLVASYFLTLAYFAFRPFRPVPGLAYGAAEVEWCGGAIQLGEGGALEETRSVSNVRKSLMASGRMSLEVLLQTDSLGQGGPARIITYSRNAMGRNFTLGQEGNGVVFRLRTTEAAHNGQYECLLIPQAFDDQKIQHLVVVFDGSEIRLHVDGVLHDSALELGGDFSEWGRNHTLVLGDEVPGGRPWHGQIYRFSIHDRALDAGEVGRLFEGKPVPGAILEYDFQSMENPDPGNLGGLRPLKYRNLLVTTDAIFFSRFDCVANIVAFIPLAAVIYMVLPVFLKQRKWVAALALPTLLGFATSGTFELVQQGIAGRVPCLPDLAYNVFGTLLGCAMLWVLLARWPNHLKQG